MFRPTETSTIAKNSRCNGPAKGMGPHGPTAPIQTETRVLRIFALSPNEAIARSRLQKEIWEDEGVIVGRSLDMFISKLRKKLELDPNIKIVVIRAKGISLKLALKKNFPTPN